MAIMAKPSPKGYRRALRQPTYEGIVLPEPRIPAIGTL
jgi:hypothetical protein